MATTLRSIVARFARCFVINAVFVMAGFAGLYIAGTTQPVVQLDAPAGVLECWNPHTAQITTEVGDACPVPVNPYR